MEYDKLRKKINKFYIEKSIPKYQTPFGPLQRYDEVQMATIMDYGSRLGIWDGQNPMTQNEIDQVLANGKFRAFHPEISNIGQTTNAISSEQPVTSPVEPLKSPMMQGQGTVSVDTSNLTLKNGQLSGGTITQTDGGGNVTNVHEIGNDSRLQSEGDAGVSGDVVGLDKAAKGLSNFVGSLGGQTGQVGSSAVNAGIDAALNGNVKGAAAGIIGGAAVQAMGIVDNVAMGDKNFSAQSQAIDSAVHGVSGALMSSGNPYAMAAGAALEGANFLTKAGGQTIQGYDVNIESSGYGIPQHMESSSSRDWGAMIGLGGIFNKSLERKLAKRNEQARMAMKAAEISEDIKFEQEARMNQVDNVLRNNQIALAGGIDTSLLGN